LFFDDNHPHPPNSKYPPKLFLNMKHNTPNDYSFNYLLKTPA